MGDVQRPSWWTYLAPGGIRVDLGAWPSHMYNRSMTADVCLGAGSHGQPRASQALRAESPLTFCLLAAAAEVEVEDGDVANARQDSDHQGHDEGQDPQHKHPGDGR